MAPYGLEATAGLNNSVNLSWRDAGAPHGTTYAVYISTSANAPEIRYTTSSRLLQVKLLSSGTGLGGPHLKARVARVYCPTTDCSNSHAGNNRRSVAPESSEEGCEEGGAVDCMGVCNGTALRNPCGVCALPADFYMGVDCAITCGGSAFISECSVCVGGRSGLAPNAHKDCQGTCFGQATRDECGVCHDEGDHTEFEPGLHGHVRR